MVVVLSVEVEVVVEAVVVEEAVVVVVSVEVVESPASSSSPHPAATRVTAIATPITHRRNLEPPCPLSAMHPVNERSVRSVRVQRPAAILLRLLRSTRTILILTPDKGHWMRSTWTRAAAALVLAALTATACGTDGGDDGAGSPAAGPTVAVTTSILGDVVAQLIGDQATVVTLMPAGADPHEFQASAREVDRLLAADALIANGGGFERGLVDIVGAAQADGVPTLHAIDAVATLDFTADHDDHDDHEDETGDDHDDHDDHEGVDPHFFTDPVRMADAVKEIERFLGDEVAALDTGRLRAATEAYLADLADLDTEVAELVATIPTDRRVLVTNHEVFGYFADRYGFELVGVVVPGGTTVESTSASQLAELATAIADAGVPAIFADTSSSNQLVETLAAEVGDVAVVELYSESLGEPGSDGATYLDMVRTNANRIRDALA